MLTDITTRCGVTGPISLWRAIGYQYTPTENEAIASHWVNGDVATLDALVYEGRRVTGADDWRALAWAAAEVQRRQEVRTANTAQAREADGLRELAAAIRQTGDESVLDRVLGCLSERTQYAVKQQLKGTGFAGR
jgi:hypothetical protein